MKSNPEKIHLRTFVTWYGNDGICYTTVNPNAVVNLEDAQQNSEAIKKISGKEVYPLLVNLTEINSISKEARDHFSMRGRTPGVKAIGMLIKSPVSRIIGNFFLGLNKPTVPTQLFTDETKAIAWLKQFSSSPKSNI
jgi:hypothetical protein